MPKAVHPTDSLAVLNDLKLTIPCATMAGPRPALKNPSVCPELAIDPVAFIRFAHGPLRPVFEADGRQFVVDDDGDRIYGVWYIPPEGAAVPIIVEAGGRPVEDF
jgi:hypothetical protein